MSKRQTKRKIADLSSEAAKRILGALLYEFKERHLDAAALQSSYEGKSPAQLKAECCADGAISEVDFDLALRELDEAELVKTGPMELFPNDPNSSVMVIMFFSKNEYSYLTEDGYKAATKIGAVKPPRAAATHVHFSNNLIQGSQIGVGDSVTQSGTFTVATTAQTFEHARDEIKKHIADEDKRMDILARLDQLEAAPDKASKIEHYNRLVGAIGDHITVLSFILPPLMHWMMT